MKIPEEIRTIALVSVGIVIVVSIVGVAGLTGLIPYSDGFDFIGALFAGIFGILIGFSLDRLSDLQKDNRTRDDFLKLIREELVTIKGRISPEKNEILLLYTDAWDSMISSGLMRLLNAKQVLQLSRVYKEIKETSFEAERIRLNRDEFMVSPNSALRAKFSYNLNRHKDRMANLINLINEVLKEEWLTPKQSS